MTRAPLLSVCIPNFNGLDMIDACIASVRAQTTSAEVEIIVHDDASTDGSAAHIRACHPDVRLIESSENVGFCIANNRMAAAAQGRYLLLLNNDATLLPDALATLLAGAERQARPAILSLPQYDADKGELLDIGARLDPFLNPVPNRTPGAEIGMVAGACLWIDKALWDELGGFPEWFGSIGEDLYLCCRARLAGHPVRALGVSGYHHRVGQSFGGGKIADGRLRSTFRRRSLSERNKSFVMVICYPAPFMQMMLPLHLALLLLEGLALSLLKWDWRYLREIYLPVFGALVRNCKEWGAVRRGAQQDRRLASADFYAVFDWVPYKFRMVVRHGLPRVN
ncbi:MAG: glycosyltransferase family 2 protein [Rhodocyclaceae bacterium]|nr:glycosyltransferase family 2 protein [Rhodocyclaceae bacterium]MDZ4214770.1 glycosyltransferase family 2 protein [Rhodocyclaceae bacterium]